MKSRCDTVLYEVEATLQAQALNKEFRPGFLLSIRDQIKSEGWVSRQQARAVKRVAEAYRVFPDQADN